MKTVALIDICYSVTDCPHSTPKWTNAGKIVIRNQNIRNGRLDTSLVSYTTQEDYDKRIKRALPNAGDIIITREAPMGEVCMIPDNLECCLGQRMVLLKPNTELVDNKYLLYALMSPYVQNQISWSEGTGTTVSNLRIPHLEKLQIPMMRLTEQRKIAKLLASLDMKIEVNNGINDNLLQQIKAIFQKRFADNQALDVMPQAPLSELCEVVTKGTTPTTLGKPFVDNGINFIKAESILDNHSIDRSKFAFIDAETNTLLKRSIIKPKDIVFTIAGSLGRFAFIDESVLPANTNQAVAIIRANAAKVMPEYLYSFFVGNWHNDYYAKRIQQAVQANLSLGTIKSLPIPMLEGQAMEDYLAIITPIISIIKANELETLQLAQLRDTLLPKLMSGELDVTALDL